MALYVPAGRRRRFAYLLGAAALVLGLVLGGAIGRATAPTVDDRISQVRADARQTAAGLRVIALHDEAGELSGSEAGDGGTDLVLRRTRTELAEELERAAWLRAGDRQALLSELAALQRRSDRESRDFGIAAEALADRILAILG